MVLVSWMVGLLVYAALVGLVDWCCLEGHFVDELPRFIVLMAASIPCLIAGVVAAEHAHRILKKWLDKER